MSNLTEFQKGQLDGLQKLANRLIGRVVGGIFLSCILEKDIKDVEDEIRAEPTDTNYSSKGVF